jgi:hypothetical protein
VHVTRIDERLATLTKPILSPTGQFELNSDDCLVVCAGFEDRALGILKNAVAVTSAFKVVIVNYQPFLACNRLGDIRELCRKAELNPIETTYDRESPAGFGATLLGAVNGVRGRIFLDVSAMSRLLIVQCLAALASRAAGFRGCVVAYAEATDYPPSPSEVEQALKQASEDPIHTILLLSSGVFDVTIVPELSSTSIGGAQTRLVVFPTFSADQLTALLNELGPSTLTMINGVPPSAQNQWRTEAIAKINRLDSMPHEGLNTSTLDYRETLDALLKLYARGSERERLLLSPTGSKMQSVAVGLFRAFVDDVQIVYPTPKQFRSPTNYTNGVGQLYTLPLDVFVSRSA